MSTHIRLQSIARTPFLQARAQDMGAQIDSVQVTPGGPEATRIAVADQGGEVSMVIETEKLLQALSDEHGIFFASGVSAEDIPKVTAFPSGSVECGDFQFGSVNQQTLKYLRESLVAAAVLLRFLEADSRSPLVRERVEQVEAFEQALNGAEMGQYAGESPSVVARRLYEDGYRITKVAPTDG